MNNAWFEVFDEETDEATGEIFQEADEAVAYALDLATEDLSAPRKKIEAMVSALAEHFRPPYLTTDESGATVFVPSEKE